MARSVCNYLHDRKAFSDGIIYVNLGGCESSEGFLTRLILQIQDSAARSGVKFDKFGHKDQAADSSKVLEALIDQDSMQRYIQNVFSQKEILVVLDNCEELMEEDSNKFSKLLNNILVNSSTLKIL